MTKVKLKKKEKKKKKPLLTINRSWAVREFKQTRHADWSDPDPYICICNLTVLFSNM